MRLKFGYFKVILKKIVAIESLKWPMAKNDDPINPVTSDRKVEV